jgi:hypothetical protein
MGPERPGPARRPPGRVLRERRTRPAARPAEFSANGDPTELRLLLSLRYRIRVDLGLAEDDYDRLLDELPSG